MAKRGGHPKSTQYFCLGALIVIALTGCGGGGGSGSSSGPSSSVSGVVNYFGSDSSNGCFCSDKIDKICFCHCITTLSRFAGSYYDIFPAEFVQAMLFELLRRDCRVALKGGKRPKEEKYSLGRRF